MPDNPLNPQPPVIPLRDKDGSLSKESAEILLKADDTNLLKQTRAGKPLSKAQRNRLEAIAAGEKPLEQEYVNTIVELAEVLGVTRKTIQRWREIEGCPEPKPDGRWHVPSWREWKRNRGGDEDEQVSQKAAKAKQILLQNERLEMRILAEKKELIPKVVAQQIFAKLVIAAKTRCFSSITQFVTLARIAESSTAAADEIRKEMISIWQEMERGEWLE